MKKIFLILLSISGLLFLFSCEDEPVGPILDTSAIVAPSITSPTDTTYVLQKDSADSVFCNFEWTAVKTNINNLAAPNYTLQIDIADSNFINAVDLISTTDTSSKFTVGDINKKLLSMGLLADQEDTVEVRVKASVGEHVDFVYSKSLKLYITPYSTAGDTTVTASVLYVPGAYQGWKPDLAPVIASAKDDGKYEGFIYFTGDDYTFKFTSAPDWNHTNFGNGGDGILDTDDGAGNLEVPDSGCYRMNVDTIALTWKYTKTDWGIIGSAVAPYDWSEDIDMNWDAVNNVFTITLDMKAGEFKFRANDAWAINFGDNDADGSLEQDGANIALPEDGNYTVTLDLGHPPDYTYSFVKN